MLKRTCYRSPLTFMPYEIVNLSHTQKDCSKHIYSLKDFPNLPFVFLYNLFHPYPLLLRKFRFYFYNLVFCLLFTCNSISCSFMFSLFLLPSLSFSHACSFTLSNSFLSFYCFICLAYDFI